MSIEIEQSRDQLRRSSVLTRNASIQNIRVLSGSYRRIGEEELVAIAAGTLQAEVFFKPSNIQVLNQRLYAAASFECKVIPESTDTASFEVLKIECVLEAIYLLREGYSPTESELNAFHRGNAIFHCWPYFREFVQNAAVRMDFPPPPIPFLRVSLPAKGADNLESRKLQGKRSRSAKK